MTWSSFAKASEHNGKSVLLPHPRSRGDWGDILSFSFPFCLRMYVVCFYICLFFHVHVASAALATQKAQIPHPDSFTPIPSSFILTIILLRGTIFKKRCRSGGKEGKEEGRRE